MFIPGCLLALSIPSLVFGLQDETMEDCFKLVEDSRYQAAIPVCHKVIGSGKIKGSDLGKTLMMLAEAQEKDGSPWLAVESLKRIRDEIDDDELKGKALKRLADNYVKLGLLDVARSSMEKLAEGEDKAAIAKSIVAAQGLYQDIQRAAESSHWKIVGEKSRAMILDHAPHWNEIHDIRIKALTKLEDWQRVIDAARSKARVETDSSETDFLIGKIYLSMGNPASGLKFITECAKLNPENKKCLSLRRKLKDIEGILDDIEKNKILIAEAISTLEELLKSVDAVPSDEPYYDPTFPKLFEGFRLPVLKLLCTKHARKKNTEEAVKYCEEAKKLDQKNPEFYLTRLGELYFSLELFDNAMTSLRQAQQLKPNDKEINELIQKTQTKIREKKLTKHYDVLGVPKDASDDAIKKAYNRLVRKYHPDKQPDEAAKKEAEEKMKEFNAAYSILSDPKKRRQYDAGYDPDDPQGGQGPHQGHGGFGGMQFSMDDLANMFRQTHGRGRSRGRGAPFVFHEDL